MIKDDDIKTTEKALDIAIKEVGYLTDGNKDIYRFKKANPKIYKYIVLGIFVEKSGMGLDHLVKLIDVFKCINNTSENS